MCSVREPGSIRVLRFTVPIMVLSMVLAIINTAKGYRTYKWRIIDEEAESLGGFIAAKA